MNTEDLMPFDFGEKKVKKNNIIKVIGVGGGGGNAINNMFKEGIENVDFIICNTDIQVLEKSPIPTKIQLGVELTEGLGAGNNPSVGKNAATESISEIMSILKDSTKMVFIAAGMGGGTGTGAAPVIAQAARQLGILTVAIVTIPFIFEGERRVSQALEGLNELKKNVDSMIVINNEKLSEVYKEYSILKAFSFADQVIATATRGISDIITKPGVINVDFADVYSVMKDSGVAVMGTGLGDGDKRAITAVKQAINSPLLNNNDIHGAKNLLVNIYSPEENEISTSEIKEINDFLQKEAGNHANLIWGITLDKSLDKSKAAVTVVATDFNDNIIPTFEVISGNNPVPEISSENEIKKTETAKLTDEEIKKRIQNIADQKFDYEDDQTINNYEKKPAYDRQKIELFVSKHSTNSVKFKLNGNNSNNFLNPLVD